MNKSGCYLKTLREHISWLTDQWQNYKFFKKLIVNFSRATTEITFLLSGIGREFILSGRDVTLKRKLIPIELR